MRRKGWEQCSYELLSAALMIELTKFDQRKIYMNAIYIERVEETPDTVITMVSGKKILVKEHTTEVARLVTEYYKQLPMFPVISEMAKPEEGETDE